MLLHHKPSSWLRRPNYVLFFADASAFFLCSLLFFLVLRPLPGSGLGLCSN